MTNFYSFLGVDDGASPQTLRTSFKQKCLQYHPDKGGTSAMFQQLLLAYETLSDADSRRTYDQKLKTLRSPAVVAKKQRRNDEAGPIKVVPSGSSKRKEAKKTPKQASSSPVCSRTEALHLEELVRQNQRLDKLYRILKQMLPETRRQFLLWQFSQGERLKFEARVLAQSHVPNLHALVPASRQDIDDECSSLGSNEADSENSSSSAEIEKMPMLCDTYLEPDNPTIDSIDSSIGDTSRKPRVEVTGLRAFGSSYGAFCGINYIFFSTQPVPELAQAVDHLLVLTDIAQKAKIGEKDNLADRLEDALHKVREDHHVDYASMGLVFRLRFRHGFWVGRRKLNTRALNIQECLKAVRLMQPFVNPSSIGGRALLARMCPHELQQQWNSFKEAYLDVCENAGWCRDRVINKLSELELLAEPSRQKACETWNLSAMRREERLTRLFSRKPPALEIQAISVLDMWRRCEMRYSSRAIKRAEREKARKARRVLHATRLRKAEQEALWKQRRQKKDMTMAELLGERD